LLKILTKCRSRLAKDFARARQQVVSKAIDAIAAPRNDMSSSDRAALEQGLRRAVLAGDERAWQALYDGAFGPLYAYIHWRCGGLRDLADDIAQETWLVAVRRLRDFDPVRGPFLAWLRGVAANVLRNQLRTRSGPSTNGKPRRETPHDEQRRREDAEHVAWALAELPERYEAVLRAKYLEQQSVAEIAALWHETPKAVESLLSRARAAFRTAYGEDTGEAIRERE
jgi:RNA polymerase sigma-70 factor, ECF subfamily